MEFHYQGVKQQPTSFEDWYNLVKALVQHAVDGWKPGELVVNKLRVLGPSASSPMLSPAMKRGAATGGVFHDHFLLSHFNKGDKDPTLKGMIPREGGLLLPSLRQQRL